MKHKDGTFAWYDWWKKNQHIKGRVFDLSKPSIKEIKGDEWFDTKITFKPELAPPKQVEAFGFYRAIVWYLCTAGVLVGAYFLIRAWVMP